MTEEKIKTGEREKGEINRKGRGEIVGGEKPRKVRCAEKGRQTKFSAFL